MATATTPRRAAAPQIRQTQLFIDGQWTPARSGKTFATFNPATEEVIAQVAEGDAAWRASRAGAGTPPRADPCVRRPGAGTRAACRS